MELAVSVIIPLYNKAPYIERTVRSVLQQTVGDFELIVVDDGSTDGSGDIVRRITDPRIRLIQQENAGASAARNRGIMEAKAKLVGFLDADDEWKPAFLEKTLGLFQRYSHIVAACTDFRRITHKRSYFANSRHYVKGQEYLIEDYFAACLPLGVDFIHASSVVVHKDALLKVGAFPVGVVYGEDLDTWGRLAFKGSVGLINEVLALYHTDARGRISLDEKPHPYPKFAQTYKQWLIKGKIPERQRESCQEYVVMLLLSHCRHLINSGQPKLARKILKEECSKTVLNRMGYRYILFLSWLPRWTVPLLRRFKQKTLKIDGIYTFLLDQQTKSLELDSQHGQATENKI